MAVTSRAGSTLNPDAPLFIPAAYQQVEDFSPEWWNLVQTSTWFRDYWLNERHENFVEETDCITDFFPEVHDLPDEIDEFSELELQLEEAVLQGIVEDEEDHAAQFDEQQLQPTAKEFTGSMKENNAEVLSRTLNVKSAKPPASIFETVKYSEKPPQIVSPKNSPRRIQQPR